MKTKARHKPTLTVEQIETEIRQMDSGITGEQLRAATLLMAASQVGTDTKALQRYTAYPLREVQKVVRLAFANGIFVEDGRVAGAAWFKKGGGAAFWLDVCCVLGWMQKTV